jgi:hypothetical protein
MYCYQEICWHSISNDHHNIALNVTVFSSSDLLEFRNAFLKMLETSLWVKNTEAVVNLDSTNCTNTPLSIMVPKHFMPMVEWLWSEKSGGV